MLALAICFSLQLHLPEELTSDPDVKCMAMSPPKSEIQGMQKRLLTFAACKYCADRGDGSLTVLISTRQSLTFPRYEVIHSSSKQSQNRCCSKLSSVQESTASPA